MNSFSDPLVHPRSGLRPNCDAASIHPITFCLNAPSRLGSLLRFVMSTSLGAGSRLLSSIPRRKTRLRCCRSLLQTCRCSSSVSTKDGNREAHITLGFAQSTNQFLPPASFSPPQLHPRLQAAANLCADQRPLLSVVQADGDPPPCHMYHACPHAPPRQAGGPAVAFAVSCSTLSLGAFTGG